MATKKTYQQIQAEIQRLQKEAAAIRDAEIAEVIAKIKTAIDAYGLTTADLGLAGAPVRTRKASAKPTRKASPKKPARAVKYRDSDGNSWSGIGKRPRWFVAALAAGKAPADLLAK